MQRPSQSTSVAPQAGVALEPCRRHAVGQWTFIALCVQLVTASASQAQILNLQHYSNRDGLPQTQGLALLQDSAGYLWIGTYGGLSRFNGREFKTYTSNDGLPSNAVHSLHVDALGRLVVGTAAGVCLKVEDAFECTGVEEGLPHSRVRDVYFDADGRAWISTDGGIAVVDRIGGSGSWPAQGRRALPRSASASRSQRSTKRLWPRAAQIDVTSWRSPGTASS